MSHSQMGRLSVLRRLGSVCCLTIAICPVSAGAQPVPIERRIAHPNGVSLRLHSVEPRADSIVVSATIANPADREIRLNRARSFVLLDVPPGVHHLNPPLDNPELAIPARSEIAATLVFIGPLAPATRQLSLAANRGIGTPDNPYDDTPVLGATLPVPARASGDASGAEVQASHPNGAAVRARRAQIIQREGARPASCVVGLRATNGNDRAIRLNQDGGLVLVDERGAAAPLKPPAENPELAVPPGQLLDATLVFDCRTVDTTGALTLSTNRGTAGTADNPYETLPVFALRLMPARAADGAPTPSASRATLAPIARSRLAVPVATAAAAVTPSPAPAGSAARTAIPPNRPADPAPAESRPATAAPRPVPTLRPVKSETGKSERGERIVMSADLLFGAAGDTVLAAAEPLLGQLAELIAKTRPREVIVAGHTDAAGGDDENMAMSERRARAVAVWLKAHAAKPAPNFVERGYGRTRPLAPNHQPDGSPDPDGRERNRRIEVTLRR
jgi:outer membrane protein OmpA-like peptidoglycan-associated protein